MPDQTSTPSARQVDLLEAAYAYVLEHGLTELSLRPLASAIGSSPRVLMFLFDNKAGLVRALLARARVDELAVLERLRQDNHGDPKGLSSAAREVWEWLVMPGHRPLLRLWVEGYARSLVEPEGVWTGFARDSVDDWLVVLGSCQPDLERTTTTGQAHRTLVLAVLRGAMLDLLATNDVDRTTAAVGHQLALLNPETRI